MVLAGSVSLSSVAASGQVKDGFFDKAIPERCNGPINSDDCNHKGASEISWSFKELVFGMMSIVITGAVSGGVSKASSALQKAANGVENAKNLLTTEAERNTLIQKEIDDLRNYTIDAKSGQRVLKPTAKKKIEVLENTKLVNQGYKDQVLGTALENHAAAENALRERFRSLGLKFERLAIVGSVIIGVDAMAHIILIQLGRSADPTPIGAIGKEAYNQIMQAIEKNGLLKPNESKASTEPQSSGNR